MDSPQQHQFDPIYALSKTGKKQVWTADVKENADGTAVAIISHGFVDGKKQTDERTYTVGKNIGRANATTAYQQCFAETEKKWKDKQQKDGYSVSGTSVGGTFYPMLAQVYAPTAKATAKTANSANSAKASSRASIFPCSAQPKLDGLRCVIYADATGVCVAQSRTGGIFQHLSHILDELRPVITPNLVFDGELYTTDIPFEELAGLIKKKKKTDADLLRIHQVKYHIYDIYFRDSPAMPFKTRYFLLADILKKTAMDAIRLVNTQVVYDQETFYSAFQNYVEEGYEGIMLRADKGVYGVNTRSSDLLKYKEFKEDEFEIVGYQEGTGRDTGTVIWKCVIPDGSDTFFVRPKGYLQFRQQQFNDAPTYVGKMLTVIYQELSQYGVPRFPVGKSIRDGE